MAKKLFVDLEVYDDIKLEEDTTKCSYYYHPDNNGVDALRELATFALFCRQCEIATCVESCPKDALEKQEDGRLKRYNMRCVSCKSCSYACPFGTIYLELLDYLASSCDFCLDRLPEGEVPLCAESAPKGAIQYIDVEEDIEKSVYKISDRLCAHSFKWVKEEKKK